MMHAIYLTTNNAADNAIEAGISAAGYTVQRTFSIPETVEAVKQMLSNPQTAPWGLLAAEVQSGAIPLLMILREQAVDMPPTLLLDRLGNDIRVPVQALQLNVEDYILASDPDIQRESRARVFAERVVMDVQQHEAQESALAVQNARSYAYAAPQSAHASAATLTSPYATSHALSTSSAMNFTWDPVAHIILVGNQQLRLSPIQARIFDRLWSRRNTTVTMQELIESVLLKPGMNVDDGVRLLRPHLVRLRNKLETYPDLAHRIINVRGSGYMMI